MKASHFTDVYRLKREKDRLKMSAVNILCQVGPWFNILFVLYVVYI